MERTLTTEPDSLPRCANCGVEIPWRPAIHHGQTYCCGGCVQGGPCYCSYDLTNLHQPLVHTQESTLGSSPAEPGFPARTANRGRRALSAARRSR